MRFYPSEEIKIDAWIGAVIRNNFLFATEGVQTENGNSLRQCIDHIPLLENHPYYKQLSGGFPKGILFDCSEIPGTDGSFILEKNRIYTIHLIIIGTYIKYYSLIVEALHNMFVRGFGYPMTSSTLIDLFETTPDSQHSILYREGCEFLNIPSYPIRLIDFYKEECLPDKKAMITFQFLTPVSLVHTRTKVNGEISYQDKLNGFPSFYQFIRSIVYRLMTLNMLYGNENDIKDKQYTEEILNHFIDSATESFLLNANIHYKIFSGTPKKGQSSVYIMDGYQGTITWKNVDVKFIPLLQFASHLGVGNDINYGLGAFKCQLTNEIKK